MRFYRDDVMTVVNCGKYLQSSTMLINNRFTYEHSDFVPLVMPGYLKFKLNHCGHP